MLSLQVEDIKTIEVELDEGYNLNSAEVKGIVQQAKDELQDMKIVVQKEVDERTKIF